MKVEIIKERLKSGLFHYSYRVRLLESYRNADGNPRNRFIWSDTYNPHRKGLTHDEHRQRFWNYLESSLSDYELSQANTERIVRQVDAVIPRLTKDEIRRLVAERQTKKEKRKASEVAVARRHFLNDAKLQMQRGEITEEQYEKLVASYGGHV